MSSIQADRKLLAPLLDRLLDEHPESRQDDGRHRHQLIRQLKESVRRDLEQLFNTRIRCLSPPPELPGLERSLLNYGLPDIGSFNLSDTEGRHAFCHWVEQLVLLFEPRIRSVKVIASGMPDPTDNTFQFRVEATLRAAAADETIILDSVLNPISKVVDIVESER